MMAKRIVARTDVLVWRYSVLATADCVAGPGEAFSDDAAPFVCDSGGLYCGNFISARRRRMAW
jgi:hypothetical protein